MTTSKWNGWRTGGAMACIVFLGFLSACAGPGREGTASIDLGDREAMGGFDPATMDRVPFDSESPPRIAEPVFEVGGANLNAIIYEAQGAGPHPTAVLLHGFPGNEKNLDLAQAIRRAGWNVVFFHYRGSWGSGGVFSFANVLEDVAGVVAAIARPEFARAHRIRPDHFALIGHSMGGFAAVVSGAELEQVSCVVSLAGGNLGLLAKQAGPSPEAAAAMAQSVDGWSGPIRGPGGKALVSEIAAQVDRFDLRTHAEALADKALLLMAGGRDRVTPLALHHTPLVEALEAAGANSLSTEIFEQGDHSFSGQRIALARVVTAWLQGSCAGASEQPARAR